MKIVPSPSVERRYTAGVVERRAAEDGTVTRNVRGYAATYGNLSSNLGSDSFPFFEIVEPGAFDDVLKDDVRALFNHDANLILARSKNGEGTLKIGSDNLGLWYEFEAPKNSAGEDLLVSLDRKDVDQSSFAFTIAQQTFEESNQGGKIITTRRIKKVAKLYDVSPVTYPAYPDTTVAVRSLEEFQRAQAGAEKPTPELHYWAARLGIL
jgi:HK97 family phage prohead protease